MAGDMYSGRRGNKRNTQRYGEGKGLGGRKTGRVQDSRSGDRERGKKDVQRDSRKAGYSPGGRLSCSLNPNSSKVMSSGKKTSPV